MSEPIINTASELKDALKRISFKNTVLDFKWQFEFSTLLATVIPGSESVPSSVPFPAGTNTQHDKQGWLVWVSFGRPDTLTGKMGRGRGRDEIIWEGTSLSGVIKTAWLLVELMVRHELMEGFQFDGARIFNPHNSVIDLSNLQKIHDGKIS